MLKFLDADPDPGYGIRNVFEPESPGSGINIPDLKD